MNVITQPTQVPEITHLLIRDVDGSARPLPLRAMSILDDAKVLIHLREDNDGLILECSSKLFKSPDSQLISITLINDGEQGPESRSILVTCNDATKLIPITRITQLLVAPPEFKIGILADTTDGLTSCSVAYSKAFAPHIDNIDSVEML